MLPVVVATVAAVHNVLSDVVAEMASLAKGGEVFSRVVLAVAVDVCGGQYNSGKPVEAEALPVHALCVLLNAGAGHRYFARCIAPVYCVGAYFRTASHAQLCFLGLGPGAKYYFPVRRSAPLATLPGFGAHGE